MRSPRIVFFNVNGSGLGHMNRCLAYALRIRGRAQAYFFSLASAIDVIEEMGFPADYFVSPYWSVNSSYAWNSELAVRFGMMLERVRPDVVVFDGTWPFQGFLAACRAYGKSLKLVWSNRGLLKENVVQGAATGGVFDLIIVPGELGGSLDETRLDDRQKIIVPPVALLDDRELLGREFARRALGLHESAKLALVSLGPGNLKDVSGIGYALIEALTNEGFVVVWARAPISVSDVVLPESVTPLSIYPLVRYMRAFDVFVGAAGYNTCCEVVQVGLPTLLIPNDQLADDQVRRAALVAKHAPVVVSACEDEQELHAAVGCLIRLEPRNGPNRDIPLNGAEIAAEAILSLATGAC